jgi:hypothetical protein
MRRNLLEGKRAVGVRYIKAEGGSATEAAPTKVNPAGGAGQLRNPAPMGADRRNRCGRRHRKVRR